MINPVITWYVRSIILTPEIDTFSSANQIRFYFNVLNRALKTYHTQRIRDNMWPLQIHALNFNSVFHEDTRNGGLNITEDFIQLNFNGSNTFGTMKISLIQG